MIRVLARLRNAPWAITREALDTIVEIAQRQGESPQAVALKLGRPLENTYDVEVRDGIAILPIAGPLFRYANLFTDLSGATSYGLLARDFACALDDPNIDAIVLNVDSPGGELNGVSEFGDQIFAARGIKPVLAYVDGAAASAAYWLASAADEVVLADTAMVGSIGTVLAIEDARERSAKAGVRRIEIVSSQSPYKRLDPASDVGRTRLQARVDALSDIFIAKVARNRGVTAETVLRDFGQGDLLIGEAAVRAGLADRVGDFEGVLAGLQRRARDGATAAIGGARVEADMSESTRAALSNDSGAQAQASADAARAEGQAQGIAEGRVAERVRIQTILTAEPASGRDALAAHLAFETDMPADAAAAALGKAPKSAAGGAGFERFDAAMREAGNPRVGVDDGHDDSVDAAVARSVALGNQFGVR